MKKKIIGFCVALLCAAVCAVTVSADAPRASDYFSYVGLSARVADDYTGIRSTFLLDARAVESLPHSSTGIQYGIIMGKVREHMGEYTALSTMTVAVDAETGAVVKTGANPDLYDVKVVYDSEAVTNHYLNAPTGDYLVRNAETGMAQITYSRLYCDNAMDRAELTNGYLLVSFKAFLIVDGQVSYLENSGTYVTNGTRVGVNPLAFYKRASGIFPEYKTTYRMQRTLYMLGLAKNPALDANQAPLPMKYYYIQESDIQYDEESFLDGSDTVAAFCVLPASSDAVPSPEPLLKYYVTCASPEGSYWEESTTHENCYILHAEFSHTTEFHAAVAPTPTEYGSIPCYACVYCGMVYMDAEATRPCEYLWIPYGYDYADFYSSDGKTLIAEKFIYGMDGSRLPEYYEKGKLIVRWTYDPEDPHTIYAVSP